MHDCHRVSIIVIGVVVFLILFLESAQKVVEFRLVKLQGRKECSALEDFVCKWD